MVTPWGFESPLSHHNWTPILIQCVSKWVSSFFFQKPLVARVFIYLLTKIGSAATQKRVICTPNPGHPVLGVHIKIAGAFLLFSKNNRYWKFSSTGFDILNLMALAWATISPTRPNCLCFASIPTIDTEPEYLRYGTLFMIISSSGSAREQESGRPGQRRLRWICRVPASPARCPAIRPARSGRPPPCRGRE